jgi:hypothetical protein
MNCSVHIRVYIEFNKTDLPAAVSALAQCLLEMQRSIWVIVQGICAGGHKVELRLEYIFRDPVTYNWQSHSSVRPKDQYFLSSSCEFPRYKRKTGRHTKALRCWKLILNETKAICGVNGTADPAVVSSDISKYLWNHDTSAKDVCISQC